MPVQTPEALKIVAFGDDANPYATNWIPSTQRYKRLSPVYESMIIGRPNIRTGSSGGMSWHNLTVNVLGEAFFSPGFGPADIEAASVLAEGSGRFSSFLKLEIEYPQGNSRVRRIRIDIGAGVDVFIPPTTHVVARLLVPDPESIPAALPVSFDASIGYATSIVVTARCVAAPVGRSIASYTQCYFLTDGPPQASFLDIRQESAVAVKVYSANGRLETEDLAFVMERGPTPDVNPLGIFGTSTPPTSTETPAPDSRYPGPANAIAYTPTAVDPGGQTVCVVQLLEI